MSYFADIFLENIDKRNVKTVFELGSRDLLDANLLQKYYNATVYSFECNPDCLKICDKNYQSFDEDTKNNIRVVRQAVSLTNGDVTFYPFDLNEYNNMGASSMYKIDFNIRSKTDPDYGRANPQTEITVKGIRIDTFMQENQILKVDLLCIDLQGYELNAIKSFGEKLRDVKYIITECSIKSTYVGGATFLDLLEYLSEMGFEYCGSNLFGYEFPNVEIDGFSEFDALFVRRV
jgi:FkbM family methyltransferase